MYLVKRVYTNEYGDVTIQNGVTAVQVEDKKLQLIKWDKADVRIGELCNLEQLKESAKPYLRVSYINEYERDFFVNGGNFKLLVNQYESQNIEGYIIFIEHEENIKTNGNIIVRRYPTEIVVVLTEGDYLEFADKKLEMLNYTLWLQTDKLPIGKNLHDYRYTHADRLDSLRIANRTKSSFNNKDGYARVALNGMPNPKGKVYRG